MKSSTIGCAVLATLFLMAPSSAATVTNNETSDQKVVIMEGDAVEQLEFAPGQTIDGICKSSCTLRLRDGNEYELEPEDVVSIEDGSLFVEPQSQGGGEPNSDIPINQ